MHSNWGHRNTYFVVPRVGLSETIPAVVIVFSAVIGKRDHQRPYYLRLPWFSARVCVIFMPARCCKKILLKSIDEDQTSQTEVLKQYLNRTQILETSIWVIFQTLRHR